MSGIPALPVWANEDATVGTWINAASTQINRNIQQNAATEKIHYVHEPGIYPARIVEPSRRHPPFAIHMDWATGQHQHRDQIAPAAEMLDAARQIF